MSLTYEICIDSTAGALAAERAGAHRVELCSALFDGGLTPTLSAVEATRAAVSSIRSRVPPSTATRIRSWAGSCAGRSTSARSPRPRWCPR
ncbi:copper homeostasis protein CutC [Planotetraspora silvatica]|uniref:copper homeostasis protein CutC n=1 Tax=Planotetraspora silvatica TaxID=234614 RepID=UPI001951235C|nr:copper homeostasis protein CutC [Planotetraspora silvatica]